MRLDFPDSICSILGFRDVGLSTSITPFTTLVSNSDPYDGELPFDEAGNPKIFTNYSIDLAGDNYIYLVCDQLGTINSQDAVVKNILGKILLSGLPGKILYNTYSPITLYYPNPIPELYTLDFKFITVDGSLFDFNNIDHSFTLKIVTTNDKPKGTDLATNIGKFT